MLFWKQQFDIKRLDYSSKSKQTVAENLLVSRIIIVFELISRFANAQPNSVPSHMYDTG